MSAETLYCGVDIGASAAKLVLVDPQATVVAGHVRPSGVDYAGAARACLDAALAEAGVPSDRIVRTVATGYGRRNVDFADAVLTEIHCHGIGCYQHHPRALTVVDIGGQDTKTIRLADDGRRIDFRMNRKCAAGTGAFVEEIAHRLDVPIDDMDRLARSAATAVRLSSFCTVFAKTEILSHLRRGAGVPEIVRGAFVAVIDRVLEMDPLAGDVVLSGGVVAHNPVIAELIAERLGHPVEVTPHAQLAGAYGAALSALRSGPDPHPDTGASSP